MSDKDKLKKEQEKNYLNEFLATKEGKEWLSYNNLQTAFTEYEKPDFLFTTFQGKKIGLEVVKFIAKTKNGEASNHLKTIGMQVCCYAKKKHKITINMTLEVSDKRKWSCLLKDHIDLQQNPGFSKIFSKSIKEKLQELIDNNIDEIKQKQFLSKWIDVDNEQIKASLVTFSKIPYCSVNNVLWCKKDPFREIQELIDQKNNKINEYLKNCDECHLLLVIPSSEEGNACWFTEDLTEEKFKHCFKSIQFYKAHFNIIKLY